MVMRIAIRHGSVEVPEDVRAAVDDKLGRLARHLEGVLDGVESAEVRFSEERNPRISEKEVCEVTMHGRGHILRAKAAAPEMLIAVDRVVEKLEHRIEKLRGRVLGRTHLRRRAPIDSPPDRTTTGPSSHGAVDDADEGQGRIVKTKQFAIKPMTPEEAALQMDLLGHDFFLFTNAETHKAAVVYRRNDGYIGLIDATA
jgi:putative sigma-54 modulation protein